MHYVYILYSQNLKKYYTGSTNDIKKRIFAHNAGKVRSTKSGKPWKLVYYEAFLIKKLAKREELFLKSGKGRERIRYLFN